MIWTACGRKNDADQPIDHQNDRQHQQRDADGKVIADKEATPISSAGFGEETRRAYTQPSASK
jgi:hypothetical protein